MPAVKANDSTYSLMLTGEQMVACMHGEIMTLPTLTHNHIHLMLLVQ